MHLELNHRDAKFSEKVCEYKKKNIHKIKPNKRESKKLFNFEKNINIKVIWQNQVQSTWERAR